MYYHKWEFKNSEEGVILKICKDYTIYVPIHMKNVQLMRHERVSQK